MSYKLNPFTGKLDNTGSTSGGGTTSWTPDQLTLSMWLDADDATTITETSGAVSQWDDKTSNSFNVVQNTSANQPTLTANGLNGKPVITFDGNDYLDVPANISAQPFTIAVVVKANSTTHAGRNYVFDGAGSSNRVLLALDGDPSGTGYAETYAGSWLENTAATHDTNAHIAVITYNGSSSIFRWDGGNSVTGNTGSAGLISGITLGSNYNQSADWFQGAIAEFIILPEASALNQEKIEGYLAHKWGLEGSLPSDHSYKTSAPTVGSGGGGASVLNDLTDVDTSTVAPSDGDVLAYDNVNSKFVPGVRVKSDTTQGGTGSSAVANIVSISQTDYDALTTPDANTIYFIV